MIRGCTTETHSWRSWPRTDLASLVDKQDGVVAVRTLPSDVVAVRMDGRDGSLVVEDHRCSEAPSHGRHLLVRRLATARAHTSAAQPSWKASRHVTRLASHHAKATTKKPRIAPTTCPAEMAADRRKPSSRPTGRHLRAQRS